MLVTVNKLAEITGFDRRKINNLIGKARLGPAETKGLGNRESKLYESADVLPAIYGTEVGSDVVVQLARLRAAQADEAELRVAQKQGELVHIDEIGPAWNIATTVVRQNMLALPKSITPHLVGRTAREIEGELDNYVRRTLDNIAATGKEFGH